MFFKKLLTFLTAVSMVFTVAVSAFPQIADAAVYVHGYTKKNGTYVAPYYRSSPDSNPYNNYSFPGNTNPYTGVTAGGNPDTYLNNYYNNTPSYSTPAPSYTFTPPPSCPLFASYDSLSGTCKCYTGYISNGSSCVSMDSYCTGKMGYGSQYDSLKDQCTCRYGFVVGSSGKCESGSSVCSSKYGYRSSYNSLDNTCSCDSGYHFNTKGDTCISNNAWCEEQFGYGVEYSLLTQKCVCMKGYQLSTTGDSCVRSSEPTIVTPPIQTTPIYTCTAYGENAELITGTDKCHCKTGYQWNSAGTACETIPVAATTQGQETTCEGNYAYSDILKKCICPVGYTEDVSGSCITQDVSCQKQFGEQSFYSPDKAQCYCRSGYSFNEKIGKCDSQTEVITGTPNTRARLQSCAVVGRPSNKKFYLKGDKIIRSLSPKLVTCFESEAVAKQQGYQKR